MTEPSLHFLVGRQPLDLLQLAFKLTEPEATGSALLMTAGSGACPAACGCELPPSFPGLLGLVDQAGDGVFRPVRRFGRTVDVLFAPGRDFEVGGYSEIIDRARQSLGGRPEILVALTFGRLPLDLPPLADGDQLTCFWEIRDVLDDDTLSSFAYLQQRLDQERTRFNGLRLYSRKSLSESEASSRTNALQEASALCSRAALMVLN